MESARQEASRTELTARQRARMADLSLLLDVIVSTTSSSAKRVRLAVAIVSWPPSTPLGPCVRPDAGKVDSCLSNSC